MDWISQLQGCTSVSLGRHKYCTFSKGFQASTNQISSDSPLERLQRLPFILKEALYKWLLSKQLPVTLNIGCSARKHMRQMISDTPRIFFCKSCDFSKYFLNIIKYLWVHFSSVDTCYGMQISNIADGGKMNTRFNIPSGCPVFCV